MLLAQRGSTLGGLNFSAFLLPWYLVVHQTLCSTGLFVCSNKTNAFDPFRNKPMRLQKSCSSQEWRMAAFVNSWQPEQARKKRQKWLHCSIQPRTNVTVVNRGQLDSLLKDVFQSDQGHHHPFVSQKPEQASTIVLCSSGVSEDMTGIRLSYAKSYDRSKF